MGACLRELLTAYEVLSSHRLMVGTPRLSVSVHEAGKKNSYLFRGETGTLATGSPAETAQEAASRVHEAMRAGEVGSVYAHIDSPGAVAFGDAYRSEPGLFRLGSSALLGYVGVDLATRTDFWLPYDLTGKPQREVHAANAPRLAAALRDLSEALRSETDPDDPTYFAKPNEAGAENYFDEDGNARDVWDSFERSTITRKDLMTEPARIDVDDSDVDLDDQHRLLFRGELFTGEVVEHLSGAVVSLECYEGGVRHGPNKEWYKDGTLRSEGTSRNGRPVGVSRGWHPNGTLAHEKVYADDGLTMLSDREWDDRGRPTRAWRNGTS